MSTPATRSPPTRTQHPFGFQLEATFFDESLAVFEQPSLPIGEAHELSLADLSPADRAALIEAATAAAEAAL